MTPQDLLATIYHHLSIDVKHEFKDFSGFRHVEVPDPQAEETFARSKLDWSEQREEPHRGTWRLYAELLRLRREHPAMSGDTVEWFGAPPGCMAFRRTGGLICALNAGDTAVPLPPGEVLMASGSLDGGQLLPDTAAWLV